MKRLILIMCVTLLVPAASWVGATDKPAPVRKLLEGLPGLMEKERAATAPIEHTMHSLVRNSTFGTVELDLTTHELVFSAPTRGKMHVKLFREETWERMDFSIVHTLKRHPYRSGITYKLILTQQERFTIFYFREYEGRVSVIRL